MTSKRLYFVLLGLMVLMVLGSVVGVVMGDSRLRKQSSQLSQLKLDSANLDQQQTVLNQAKKDVVKYSELTNLVKAIVPQEKDQARTVREIVQLANQAHISIASISFPSSSLGQAVSGKTTPTGNTPTTQVKAVSGISGLYQMDINIQTGQLVSYDNLLDFLHRLETNRRTAQVSSLTIQPDANNRNLVTFTLSLSVFLKP